MAIYSIARARKGAALGFLFVLGGLTAFDSIAIDMYLPAFNAIEHDLALASGTMPISLSIFLIGLAIGQAICGSVADSLGRRTPLLLGIILFGAASCLIALSSNITMFMIGRFFQGIGGAAGLVIPRAIVSDVYDAKRAPRVFTFLVQVQSISPILAPILGGLMLSLLGWRSIFWILAVCAGMALAIVYPVLPETQSVKARTRLTVVNIFKNYFKLLKNARYVGMIFANGLIMGTLFGYIGVSAFIFMTYFNLSSSTYSIIFAAFSIGMILFGQLNMYLLSRMQLQRNLRMGFFIHLFFLCSSAGALLAGHESLLIVCGLLFLAVSSLSFLFGGLTSDAMFSVPRSNAGSAAALLGMMQYAVGGGAGIVIGILHDGTLLTPVLVLLACSSFAFFCWRLTTNLRSQTD